MILSPVLPDHGLAMIPLGTACATVVEALWKNSDEHERCKRGRNKPQPTQKWFDRKKT
jgi:hypothetical protein